MALADKKYTELYESTKKTNIESVHSEGLLSHMIDNPEDDPHLTSVLKEIKDLQEELDALRTEISANKDKTTFPGFGTTNTTVLRGNTEIPPITIKLGTGITLTLVVELDGRGSGVVGAVVEDTRNRKTYTGSINLTEKR